MFSKIFIERPVFTLVISFLLIILGLYHLKSLHVSQLPNIEQGKVNVYTTYRGASPELVESSITTPIENAISSISGIDAIKSNSEMGQSNINIRFKLGTDMIEAISEVRNKVSSTVSFLPTEATTPIVVKVDDNNTPTIILGLTSKTRSPLKITDYANRYLKPQIEQLSQVGKVVFWGGRDYQLKIIIHPEKLQAKKISVSTLTDALNKQNVNTPGGQIKSEMRYYSLVINSSIKDVAAIKRLIVDSSYEGITRLEDVADVKFTSQKDESIFRINGQSAIGIAIIPQVGANPITISKSIHKFLNRTTPTLPKDLQLSTVFDASLFIKSAISEVYKALFEASLFVGLIIFLFLGRFKTSLIPLTTLPICIIASFILMHLLGFSLNTISLLALVLAVGLVVDDAIVILENCYRHLQLGKDKITAALIGTKEVQFAVIAMTLTLAAVYTPLAFIKGFSGKLYLEFGLTLAIAVIFSGFVALTLSPMLSARLLTKKQTPYTLWLDKSFDSLSNAYQKLLRFLLPLSKITFVLVIFLIGLSIYNYQKLPKALAPNEDQSYAFGILSPPESASLNYTLPYTQALENLYDDIPEKKNYMSVTTPNNVFSILQLKPWQERTRAQKEISQSLNQKLASFTGVSGFMVNPSPLGRRGENNGFQIKLMSYGNFSHLSQAVSDVEAALKKYPGLTQVDNSLSLNQLQYEIDFNRALMAELGISMQNAQSVISTLLSGYSPGYFNYSGQSYPIYAELSDKSKANPKMIDNLYVTSDKGQNIPLSEIAKLKNSLGPMSFSHYNKMKSTDIYAELAPKSHYGKLVSDVSEILDKTLPEDVRYVFTGAAKDYLDSKSSTLLAFSLALLFIYLILAAQFESFITPFIILLTVPGSMLGGIWLLSFYHSSINLYSSMGLVTLIGLISKHGILIIEFCQQKLKEGQTLEKAIIEGATLRLRPILMTTCAMVLGALPLMLATGAGAEARRQLGIVIVGGMTLGTILSLFVVPMAYFAVYNRLKSHCVPLV